MTVQFNYGNWVVVASISLYSWTLLVNQLIGENA